MNANKSVIWGMTHNFNTFVLWGKKTPTTLEAFIGEFATLEQAKQKANELKADYAKLRISQM